MPAGRFRLVIAILAGVVGLPGHVFAEALDRPDIGDLELGVEYSVQPTRFREFACGTNGGPPSVIIGSFADFGQCPREAETGLHEVTFRYDDEIEYYARAMNLRPIADRFGGTRFGTFPVIVSAMFDEIGVLRGYRIVTDDRGSLRERRVAHSMSVFAKAQFSDADWTCETLPAADGETPLGREFVKENCTASTPEGWNVILKTRLLHRPGQSAVDPHTGQIRAGYYESTARLEVYEMGWGPGT